MTVMFSSSGSVFFNSETNLAALTTSKVVTPNNLQSIPSPETRRNKSNVKISKTEKGIIPFRIIDAHFLENLGADGNSGIDGIGDDSQEGLGSMFGDTLRQVPDDTGIRVEQIVSGHSWLSGDSGGDQDNIGFIKSMCQAVSLGFGSISGDLQISPRREELGMQGQGAGGRTVE